MTKLAQLLPPLALIAAVASAAAGPTNTQWLNRRGDHSLKQKTTKRAAAPAGNPLLARQDYYSCSSDESTCGDFCCSSDETCVSGGCCPSGDKLCGSSGCYDPTSEVCCGSSSETCDSDEICCTDSAGGCCPTGDSCSDDFTCAPGGSDGARYPRSSKLKGLAAAMVVAGAML